MNVALLADVHGTMAPLEAVALDIRSGHSRSIAGRRAASGKRSAPVAIPKPGRPVRGSTTGAPIMALDLLGRRWAMGILWNLAGGPSTFRALQALAVDGR
ncbi:MAG TPA: hypothetical protein VL354_10975 [Spirochaetia bacterium]|nr:hypothetical protein [Spirochaetia bacterium]